ncbi:MAG: cation-translocating P-type ATPase [Gammaproteobacteria bacterium]|nr:cation-translocating P-type ATPase [Gammaproteobacteria bacterium]
MLEDQIRKESFDAISKLKEQSIKCFMLTGDNKKIAENVSKKLNLDGYFAEVLPHQKQEKIKELQDKGEFVAMVGDGINDAPVLAAAQVSIAMGSGTQIAIMNADILLLSEHLSHLASGIQTATNTLHIIRQNMTWALVYNLVALPVAATGHIQPWMAALGMSLSSIIVVLNAMRLNRHKSND